jgi:hypothetical protein
MQEFDMNDDEKYVALYDKYKQNRGSSSEENDAAMKYLDAAIALRERGNVSDDAVIGAAYL